VAFEIWPAKESPGAAGGTIGGAGVVPVVAAVLVTARLLVVPALAPLDCRVPATPQPATQVASAIPDMTRHETFIAAANGSA
jgi:hypothetical protein